MIKRRALRASAFHFLFHAEGRVTPGRGGSFGTEVSQHGGVTVIQQLGGLCEFLLLWRDGRVTPGWAFCLVTFAWGALDGSTGGDDEVSGRDTLRGASVRCPEAPLTLA